MALEQGAGAIEVEDRVGGAELLRERGLRRKLGNELGEHGEDGVPVAPRRFGKTSILRAAEDIVARQNGIVLRYDAEAFTSIDMLAARMLGDTAARLTGTIDRATAAIREFFAGVRPTATWNATENKWSVSLAGTAGRSTGAPLLADVLDGVERAAVKGRRTVAIVIDEFQRIVTTGGVEAEGQIRAAIQRQSASATCSRGPPRDCWPT